MAWPNVLLLLALLAGQTPQYPPPYPRPGTTPVFENDVIAVWDVAWLKQKYPLHTHRYDLIGVSYVEGDRIITQGDAPGRLTNTKPWVFQSNVAGNTHVEEGASDPPMRAILMEVKTAAPRRRRRRAADGLRQVVGAPSWKNKRSVRAGRSRPAPRRRRTVTSVTPSSWSSRGHTGDDAEGDLRAGRHGARGARAGSRRPRVHLRNQVAAE